MSGHPQRIYKKRGVMEHAFTLLEVILAMTIFGAGVLGVIAAFSFSSQASASAYRLAEAARLAERQMVLAVHQSDESLLAEQGQVPPYTWESTYESGPDGLTLASITVTWTDKGQADQFVLRQLFSPRQDEAE